MEVLQEALMEKTRQESEWKSSERVLLMHDPLNTSLSPANAGVLCRQESKKKFKKLELLNDASLSVGHLPSIRIMLNWF